MKVYVLVFYLWEGYLNIFSLICGKYSDSSNIDALITLYNGISYKEIMFKHLIVSISLHRYICIKIYALNFQ